MTDTDKPMTKFIAVRNVPLDLLDELRGYAEIDGRGTSDSEIIRFALLVACRHFRDRIENAN